MIAGVGVTEYDLTADAHPRRGTVSAEPTLQDILDAVNALGSRMDRIERKVDALDRKVDRLTGLVVDGFSGLGVAMARQGASPALIPR